MLDVKKLLTKVLVWIKGVGYGEPTDYSSVFGNATSASPWTAPASGMMVLTGWTTSGQRAYWYVIDKTTSSAMVRATRLETANYQIWATFPVVRGHQYYSVKSNIESASYAKLYPIVGGYFITSLLSTIERWWRYVRCEETVGESTQYALLLNMEQPRKWGHVQTASWSVIYKHIRYRHIGIYVLQGTWNIACWVSTYWDLLHSCRIRWNDEHRCCVCESTGHDWRENIVGVCNTILGAICNTDSIATERGCLPC